VGSSQVEVVNEFTYLMASTTCDGSSESEILWHIGIARNCIMLLEKHVWKSYIQVDAKVSLCRVYVFPVLVSECFFWYRLTRVVPDKIHRDVKWLCVYVCGV